MTKTKLKFDKTKVENAIKAVESMCLGCKEHTDDCPLVQINKELKGLL